jgi:cation diffusion facilitator family transporter
MAQLNKSGQSMALSGIISFFLMILKISAGIFANSIALLSEALDSFVDILSMIGSYAGIRIFAKKPNNEFNYGLGKAQNIASFLVSLLIIFAAAAIGKIGYDSFFLFQEIKNSIFAYIIGLLSIAISAFLSFYLLKKSNELCSEQLFINSRERLADAFRGIIVVASIYLNESGIPYAQGIAAITICFAVFITGIKSLALSIKGLADGSQGKKITEGIGEIIKKNYDVSSFKNLRLKKSGHYIFGDAEIKVDKKYSIMQAHEIADKIEKQIMKEYCEIASFIMHVEPNE